MIVERQLYNNHKWGTDLPMGIEFFQPKLDGIWARVFYRGHGLAEIFSRTGELKATISVPNSVARMGAFTAIGEYMFGQQRSQDEQLKGKLFLFDLVSLDLTDLRTEAYRYRYAQLKNLVHSQVDDRSQWQLVPCYSLHNLQRFWETQVVTRKCEGVVLRNWSDFWQASLLRCKYTLTLDLRIVGMEEGQGKYSDNLGALVLAYDDVPDLLIKCSGMTDPERFEFYANADKYLGRVVEVEASGLFDSGAPRHPRFLRMRDDKQNTLCLRQQLLTSK